MKFYGGRVGILNASKGIMFLKNDSSPILQLHVNFNWENDFPLISKNSRNFKKINEMRKGKILTEKIIILYRENWMRKI